MTKVMNWLLRELNTNPDKSRQKVLADFSESQENKDSVAALIGNGIQYVEFTGQIKFIRPDSMFFSRP